MPDAEDKSVAAPEEEQAADEESSEEAEERGPETSVERTGPTECVIRVEADADYLRERYQDELSELQSEIKLPGFRAGKAPVGLVERRMGTSLRNDLISSVAAEGYEQAIEDNDLRVVAQVDAPDLENFTWEPGQPAEFEFRCDVLPDVELEEGTYKGLVAEVPALEVNDELLQQEMDRFAQQFASYDEVTEGGIDWDDYVEADVSVADVDWTETIGFFPRAERIGPFAVEGIKAALTDAKVGDEVEVEAEAVEDQIGDREQLKDLAGQKVQLRLILKQATRRNIPEIDDELAKKIGMESVDEIRSAVSERLEAALKEQKERMSRDGVVRALLEKVECPMPESLIENASEEEQVRGLVRMLRSGVARQDAERAAEANADRTRDAVQGRLKATFLLRKVAEAEGIYVTESEVDAQTRAFAAQQGWREEKAEAYMEKRGMARALRDDMREAKTLDFLLEHAEIEEVPPEQFAPAPPQEETETEPEESGEERDAGGGRDEQGT